MENKSAPPLKVALTGGLGVTQQPLPCPFCGQSGIDVVEGSTFRWRVVACQHCDARCGEIRCTTTGPMSASERECIAYQDAVAEWNRRAVTPNVRVQATGGIIARSPATKSSAAG